MEEGGLKRNWKEIYEHLCDKKPPLRLNILETVALDRMTIARPLYWLHTSPEGFIQSKNIRSLSADAVIQIVISATTSESSKVPRYFIVPEESHEVLALALMDTSRITLTAKSLVSLSTLISTGLDGIVLLKAHGKKFDRRVFVHEVKVIGNTYDDIVAVRNLSNEVVEGVRYR